MIKFVNAKLNLGLNITERRPDGYHNLETIFIPVGKYNGRPENPEPFCDILEITPCPGELQFDFQGNKIDCPVEKNLVVKAARIFEEDALSAGVAANFKITLEKHLPDGAGLGGGSADATFTYLLLKEMSGMSASNLEASAKESIDKLAKLGADCPFFVINKPVYAEGIGEKMTPVYAPGGGELLGGWWALIIKPDVYVSTKEAFAGIIPKKPAHNLRDLIKLPVEEWRGLIVNDFEDSLFPQHPVLAEYKQALYDCGAVYASMSGSGASLYGLYPDREKALAALAKLRESLNPAYSTVCKL